MSEFRRRYLGELPQQMQANLATLEALNTQLRLNSDNQVRAVERREALTAQLAEAASFAAGCSAPRAGARTRRSEPPRACAWRRLKQELTTALARYTEAHPDRDPAQGGDRRRRARAGRREPAAKPSRRPRRLLPPARTCSASGRRSSAAEAELKILKAEEQRLRGAIAAYQARVENTPKREQEFQEISRDYETTKELYQSLGQALRGSPARREHGAAPEGRAVPGPGPGHALAGAGRAEPPPAARR